MACTCREVQARVRSLGGPRARSLIHITTAWKLYTRLNVWYVNSKAFDFQSNNVYIKHPLLWLECRSDTPILIRCPLTSMKLSTSHSYHTLRSSVWRHMLTSTSEPAGRCMGVCRMVSLCYNTWSRIPHTLSAKKMGNHEIMSLDLASIVTGFVDSSTGPSEPL